MPAQNTKTNIQIEDTRRMLEEALDAHALENDGGIARQIKPILLSNLDRGRVQYFSDGKPGRIRAYVWHVSQNFSSLNQYIHQLQIERSDTVWEPLIKRMQTWAYNFFLRKGSPADDHTRQTAIECASEAAIILLEAHYPYDTEFDAWAHVIVQNACRKHIHKAARKSAVPDSGLVELEDELLDPEDPLLEVTTMRKESGRELVEALNQLSEARRTIIQSIYFDGLEPTDLAAKMGKTVGAIYSLQFNALKDLRKILGTNMDNLNE